MKKLLVLTVLGLLTFFSISGIVTATPPGDVNADGSIDFDDIAPFVAALQGEEYFYSQYPTGCYEAADCNFDGFVDFDDIAPFVGFLTG